MQHPFRTPAPVEPDPVAPCPAVREVDALDEPLVLIGDVASLDEIEDDPFTPGEERALTAVIVAIFCFVGGALLYYS